MNYLLAAKPRLKLANISRFLVYALQAKAIGTEEFATLLRVMPNLTDTANETDFEADLHVWGDDAVEVFRRCLKRNAVVQYQKPRGETVPQVRYIACKTYSVLLPDFDLSTDEYANFVLHQIRPAAHDSRAFRETMAQPHDIVVAEPRGELKGWWRKARRKIPDYLKHRVDGELKPVNPELKRQRPVRVNKKLLEAIRQSKPRQFKPQPRSLYIDKFWEHVQSGQFIFADEDPDYVVDICVGAYMSLNSVLAKNFVVLAEGDRMAVRACYEWLTTVLRDGQKVGPYASQRNVLLEWSAVSPGQLLLDCIFAMFTRNCSWRPSRFPAIFDPGTGGKFDQVAVRALMEVLEGKRPWKLDETFPEVSTLEQVWQAYQRLCNADPTSYPRPPKREPFMTPPEPFVVMVDSDLDDVPIAKTPEVLDPVRLAAEIADDLERRDEIFGGVDNVAKKYADMITITEANTESELKKLKPALGREMEQQIEDLMHEVFDLDERLWNRGYSGKLKPYSEHAREIFTAPGVSQIWFDYIFTRKLGPDPRKHSYDKLDHPKTVLHWTVSE